jgi:hypothetical protein
MLDLDIVANDEDYSDELIERFSHLPRACVLDIYENLCRRDYGWALDYLSNMEPDDVIMYQTIDDATKVSESKYFFVCFASLFGGFKKKTRKLIH